MDRRFVFLIEFVRSDDGGSHDIATRREFDFSEVAVLAPDEIQGGLIAAQMVACRPGLAVTRVFPSC